MSVSKKFFGKSADKVARDLLGCILVFLKNGRKYRAKIVETEAYFDEQDPASRAVSNGDLRMTMKMEAGTILVYGIHNSWMLNIVTGETGKASAVLIRALEPLNFKGNCSGPGKLSKCLGINKLLHKKNLGKEMWIEEGEKIKEEDIVRTHRIGVKNDLKEKMRFYVRENGSVSR